MKKAILRWANKAAQRWQKMVDLDKKLSLDNFPDIVKSVNGKETNKTVPLYSARTYIGKVKQEGESIYSDDVLITYMNYFFKQTEKWTNIDLVIAPWLSEILNGKKSMEGYYSWEEEKKHIVSMAKKYFHERYRDLRIANIELLHPELFDALKTNGSKWLESSSKPIVDPLHFTSLDIARYLYRVAKNNNDFMQKISDLKTQEQKSLDKNSMGQNESDRYGLCEIAMRLSDFLTWTHTQCGVRRQKLYDDIIVQILNEKAPVKYGNEIKELRAFCKEVLKFALNKNFYAVHFDTKKSENIEEKHKEKEKTIKKISKGIASKLLYLLLGLSIPTWIYSYKEYQKEREIKEQQQKIDEEFASKQKMFFYGDMGGSELVSSEAKIEQINRWTDDVLTNIIARYQVEDNEEIIKILRSYIKDDEIVEKFANGNEYEYAIANTGDEFVKKNGDVFVGKDVNKLPYDHLKEYETYFREVILDKNISDETKVSIQKKPNSLEDIYPYILSPSEDSYLFNIQLECIKDGEKRYLVEEKSLPIETSNEYQIKRMMGNNADIVGYYAKDGYRYLKKWKTQTYSYAVATAQDGDKRKSVDIQKIAYDYFYQNRPIIHKVYEKFGAIYRGVSSDINRETDAREYRIKDDVKQLITKDLLNTQMIDKLPENNTRAIMLYLDWFVKRNAAALSKDSIPTTPYETYLKEHKEAFQNTFTLKANDKTVPDFIDYDGRRREYKFDYLGKYYSQEGVEYDIWEVVIHGKKYLYARDVAKDTYMFPSEEWVEMPNLNYRLDRGKEVVKDFMDKKNK